MKVVKRIDDYRSREAKNVLNYLLAPGKSQDPLKKENKNKAGVLEKIIKGYSDAGFSHVGERENLISKYQTLKGERGEKGGAEEAVGEYLREMYVDAGIEVKTSRKFPSEHKKELERKKHKINARLVAMANILEAEETGAFQIALGKHPGEQYTSSELPRNEYKALAEAISHVFWERRAYLDQIKALYNSTNPKKKAPTSGFINLPLEKPRPRYTVMPGEYVVSTKIRPAKKKQ